MEFRLFEASDILLYLGWVNQEAIWEVDNAGPFETRTEGSFDDQWKKIVRWQRSWIIEANQQPIGYIGFVSDENDGLTDEFFIVIGETGEWAKGYGKQAMHWLFEKGRRLGLSRLTGQVLGNNERALHFYAALGFKLVEQRDPSFQRNGRTWRTLLIERPL